MAKRETAQPDELQKLGQQLLAESLPESRTIEGLVDGMKASHRSLQESIGTIMGTIGLRMMVAQAVRQTAVRYPVVTDIGVYEDDIDVEVALAHKTDGDYAEVRTAFEDLLVAFARLLAEMVGEDVAGVLMGEAVDRAWQGNDRRKKNE